MRKKCFAVLLLSIVLCMSIFLAACTKTSVDNINDNTKDREAAQTSDVAENFEQEGAKDVQAPARTENQQSKEQEETQTTSKQTTSQQTAPQQTARQETVSQQTTPQKTTTQETASQQTTSLKTTTQETVSPQTTSQKTTTQQTALQNAATQQTTSKNTTTQQTSKANTALQQQMTTQQTTAQQTVTQESTSDDWPETSETNPVYSHRYTPRNDIAQQVFAEMNKIRQEVGARVLIWDGTAAQKAADRIRELVESESADTPSYYDEIITASLDSTKSLRSQILDLMKMYRISTAFPGSTTISGALYPLIYSTQVTRAGVSVIRVETLVTQNGKTEAKEQKDIVAIMYIEELGKETHNEMPQLIERTIKNTIASWCSANSVPTLTQTPALSNLAMEYCKAFAEGKDLRTVDSKKYVSSHLGGMVYPYTLEPDVLMDWVKKACTQYFQGQITALLDKNKSNAPSSFGLAIYINQGKVYAAIVLGN